MIPCLARLRFLLVGTIAAMCSAFAFPGPAEYHTRVWNTDDGLPHNSIGSILQDSAGYLWFATLGGLARFDGQSFEEFPIPTAHRRAGFNIRALAEVSPGVIVVLPTSGALLQLKGRTWSEHPLNKEPGPKLGGITGVTASTQGDIWVHYANRVLLRWSSNGGARWYTERGFTRARYGLSLSPDSSGGMWISGEKLWHVDANGDLSEIADAPRNPGRVGQGRNGTVWLASGNQLLQLGTKGQLSQIDLSLDIGRPRHLFEDATGAVWISTRGQGALRVKAGTEAQLAAHLNVSSVNQDREGTIWIATDGDGALQVREKLYRRFSSALGLQENLVSSLCEDRDGRIWVANRSGGLASLNALGEMHPSGLTGPLAFANVVCADTDGHIWFGGGDNGLFRWKPGSEPPEHMSRPRSDLRALLVAKDGSVWYAGLASQGVFPVPSIGFYPKGRAQPVEVATNAQLQIRTIAEDTRGVIWLGSREGVLLRYEHGRLETHDIGQETKMAPIHAICAEGPRLWIATANGLILLEGNQRFHLTRANGLSDDIIEDILPDAFGCLWFASRRGLYYAAIADLVRAARDTFHRVECFRIGPGLGLAAFSPTANYHPTALQSRDGLLWFATAQGAIAIDPARIPRSLPPVPARVERLFIDEQLQPPSSHLRIPRGQHRVEFQFSALSFISPESVKVRHRLDGVDRNWVDSGPQRSATYASLPPGEYRLRVVARNSSGIWSNHEATLPVTVVPALWETTAFRVTSLMLSCVLLAGLTRFVTQRRLRKRLLLLEQQQARTAERTRIARDLHDELGAGMTEVGLLAERLVKEAPEPFGRKLAALSIRTRRLAADLSSIVWTMNTTRASPADFASFLRRYSSRLFRNTGIECSTRAVTPLPSVSLAPDTQHQLLAATKEALNNVQTHARSSHAEILLKYSETFLVVSIRDDGVGFVPEASSSLDGNGLRNMRTRMAEIGGSFELKSAPGAGTEVTFRIPCPPKA